MSGENNKGMIHIITLITIFLSSLAMADNESQRGVISESEVAMPDTTRPLMIREKKYQKKSLNRIGLPRDVPAPKDVPKPLSTIDSEVRKPQVADTLVSKSIREITIESDETRDIHVSPDTLPLSREFSLESELIAPEDFDYNVFKGVLISDLTDKKKIEGFIYFPGMIWGEQLISLPNAVVGLSEALKQYSKLVPKVDGNLMLGSPDLHKYPFIYIGTDQPFLLTPIEQSNFREYLLNGGFAVVDNCVPDMEFSPAEGALRKMLFDAAHSIGDDAVMGLIPNNHPLYHCFFDYDGPPIGSEIAWPIIGVEPVYTVPPVPFLEGLWIKDRLAVIYSDKGYGNMWANIGNNPAQQKFGINLVMYALLQDGGKGKRVNIKPEKKKIVSKQ